MSNPVEQIVETHLKVVDHVTAPAEKVAKSAEHAAGAVTHLNDAVAHTGAAGAHAGGTLEHIAGTLTHLAGIAGVVGAAFSFHEAIESTEKYLKNIKEVKELTGSTAAETDFLFSSARRAGVGYDQMSQIMFQLSKRGSMMEQTMAAATNHIPGMAAKFARLGVDVTKGPVAAIEQMSKQVKKGKLDAGDLMAQFRVPRGQANEFRDFLEQMDPKKLAAARKGKGGFLSEEDLENFVKLEKAQHRIADTWNRIKVTVVKNLMPIAANLAEKFADNLEKALPTVQKIGQFLSDHMDQIVTAAKTFVTIMTAKKLLDTLTKITSKGGFLETLGSKGLGGILGGGGAGGGMLAGLGKQISGIVSGLWAAAPALLAIAAAVALVYLGYQAIQANVDGVKDRLLALWDKIRARFELIGDSLSAIWTKVEGLFGGKGTFLQFIGKLAGLGFEKLVQGFDFLVHVVQTLIGVIGELAEMFQYLWTEYLAEPARKAFGFVRDQITEFIKNTILGFNILFDFISPLLKKLGVSMGSDPNSFIKQLTEGAKVAAEFMKPSADLWMKHWKATEDAANIGARKFAAERAAEKATNRETSDARPPSPNYDFRGSRFDITQNFAEGFDPDRIAVAFSNDLANLGENKAQSGFAPIFSAH